MTPPTRSSCSAKASVSPCICPATARPAYSDQMHQLGLAGMARAFAKLEADPQSDDLSHAEWLALLLDREATDRHERRLRARLRYARLRHQAAVEDVECRPDSPARVAACSPGLARSVWRCWDQSLPRRSECARGSTQHIVDGNWACARQWLGRMGQHDQASSMVVAGAADVGVVGQQLALASHSRRLLVEPMLEDRLDRSVGPGADTARCSRR